MSSDQAIAVGDTVEVQIQSGLHEAQVIARKVVNWEVLFDVELESTGRRVGVHAGQLRPRHAGFMDLLHPSQLRAVSLRLPAAEEMLRAANLFVSGFWEEAVSISTPSPTSSLSSVSNRHIVSKSTSSPSPNRSPSSSSLTFSSSSPALRPSAEGDALIPIG